jgi:hypothetical protein
MGPNDELSFLDNYRSAKLILFGIMAGNQEPQQPVTMIAIPGISETHEILNCAKVNGDSK